MKLTTHLGLALFVFAAGCGDTESAAPTPAPSSVTPAPTTTAPTPPTPPARTLTTKRTMPTSTENLVVDPQFQSLWTALDETGFGIYEAFVTDGKSEVRVLADTPAGPGAAVLSVTPEPGAALTMMVVGGKGPFEASIWVAAPEDSKTSIEVASLYEQTSIVLSKDPESRREIGGVSYFAYRGHTTENMPGSLYLIADIRDKAAVKFVAPEVVAGAAGKAQRRSARPLAPASAKALRAARAFESWRAAHITMSPPPARGSVNGVRGRVAKRVDGFHLID